MQIGGPIAADIVIGEPLSIGESLVRSDWRSRWSAAALKARVQGSNPGGVCWIAVLGKLLTDHASVASAV